MDTRSHAPSETHLAASHGVHKRTEHRFRRRHNEHSGRRPLRPRGGGTVREKLNVKGRFSATPGEHLFFLICLFRCDATAVPDGKRRAVGGSFHGCANSGGVKKRYIKNRAVPLLYSNHVDQDVSPWLPLPLPERAWKLHRVGNNAALLKVRP